MSQPHSSSWPVRPLGDLVEILDRQRVPVSAKEREKRPGSVPYFGATGQVGTIDEMIFDEPLVLLGEDGVSFLDPLAQKAYLIDGPAWVNNHAHVLRPSGLLDRRFLKYWLDAVDYRGYVSGTTRLKLTQGAMRRLPVPVPSIDEQHAIVEAIERVFSIVANCEENLLRAGLRAKAMRRSVANRLAGAGPGATLQDLLREELRNGRSVKDGRGPAVLRLSALRGGRVDLDDAKSGEWSHTDAEPFLVAAGDFLVSRGSGTLSLVGRGALVQEDPVTVAFPDTMIRVRPDVSLIRPEFLRLVWDSDLIRTKIESRARTTAGIYKINQPVLEGLKIPLPDLVDQTSLVEWGERVLAYSTRLVADLGSARQRTSALHRSISKTAFEGRLTGAGGSQQSLGELEEAFA